jgi:membrane-bound lytic murein transglycosylase
MKAIFLTIIFCVGAISAAQEDRIIQQTNHHSQIPLPKPRPPEADGGVSEPVVAPEETTEPKTSLEPSTSTEPAPLTEPAPEPKSTSPTRHGTFKPNTAILQCLAPAIKNRFEERQARKRKRREAKKAGKAIESDYVFQKVEGDAFPAACHDSATSDLKAHVSKKPTKKITKVKPDANVEATPEQETAYPVGQNMNLIREGLANQLKYCQSKSAEDNQAITFDVACRRVTREEYCTQTITKMSDLAEQAQDNLAVYRQSLLTSFEWYRNVGRLQDGKQIKKGEFQTTAFNAPILIASLEKTETYNFPIWGKPDDMVVLKDDDDEVAPDPDNCGIEPITQSPRKTCLKNPEGTTPKYSPMPDRRGIDSEGKLVGKARILAYVENPLDVVDLMVEGDGAIKVRQDGKEILIHLNYAGQNGYPRSFVSNILSCVGSAGVSAHSYFASHPEVANGKHPEIPRPDLNINSLLNYDQSYVFFKEGVTHLGVDEIPLTPYVSLATDPTLLPTGSATLYIRGGKCKMGLPQDIGGAIGEAHIDEYFGEGPDGIKASKTVNGPATDMMLALPIGAGKPIEGCTNR